MHYFALPRAKPARQFLARYAIATTALALIGGCIGRPASPILQPAGGTIAAATATAARVDALLPADALLIGEQHDAAEHQQIEQQVVAHLAGRCLLAALAIEMADAGASTAKLKPTATEQQAQIALKWNDKGWPWAAYARQ